MSLVAEAILKREKDVVCMVRNATGETLMLWMPLLFRPDSIKIIVTPLTLLGKQNATSLDKAGIQAITISWETATAAEFHVGFLNDLV